MTTGASVGGGGARPRGLGGLFMRLIGDPGGLVRGSLSGAAMRMFEVLLGLTSLTLLARTLGPGGLGVYAIGMATVMLVGFVHAGLPMLTAREVSIATVQGDAGRVKGMILFAVGCALVSATVLAAICATVVLTVVHGDTQALLWALGLLPAFALSSLASSTLAGLRRFVVGQAFDLIVRPGPLRPVVGCRRGRRAAHAHAGARVHAAGGGLGHIRPHRQCDRHRRLAAQCQNRAAGVRAQAVAQGRGAHLVDHRRPARRSPRPAPPPCFWAPFPPQPRPALFAWRSAAATSAPSA